MELDKSNVLDNEIENGFVLTTIPQLLRMWYKHLIELDSLVTCLTSHIRRLADDDESPDYEDDESTAKNAKEGVTTQLKRSFADFLSDEIENHKDTMRLIRELVNEVQEYRKRLRGQ